MSAKERWKQARTWLAKHSPDSTFSSTESASSYERVLAFLSSRGAEICMVGMPVSSIQRELRFEFPAIEDAQACYGSLASAYGVRYVELSSAITDEHLFFDSNHLNERGAEEFAPIVKAACFETESPMAEDT